MNPEIETRIEAYLFAEMPANELAQFENQLAQNADLQALVAERREQAELIRRAFIRQKVREAQAESTGVEANVPRVEGRTVSMQPFRFAIAASFAAVLAAAAYFLWQHTEKLQNEIADAKTEQELLERKLAKKDPALVENPFPTVEIPVTEKPVAATEIPKTDDGIKILTEKPGKAQPKIAQAPTDDRGIVPQTYGIETRGTNQADGSVVKGEKLYQTIHQNADLSQFKGTGFDNFIGLFNRKKYSDANGLLTNMKVTASQEDARELLLGISYLEMGDTNRSVQHLGNIYDAQNAHYQEGQWWLALAFCREGKLSAARDIFQKIIKTAGHPYRSQAENALRNF